MVECNCVPFVYSKFGVTMLSIVFCSSFTRCIVLLFLSLNKQFICWFDCRLHWLGRKKHFLRQQSANKLKKEEEEKWNECYEPNEPIRREKQQQQKDQEMKKTAKNATNIGCSRLCAKRMYANANSEIEKNGC